MDFDVLVGAAGLMVALIALRTTYNHRSRRRRQHRIRPLNLNRQKQSQFLYFKKIKSSDQQQFFKYTRMSVPQFEDLLKMVTPSIKKRNISLGISPEERLAITLQYLSQGGSMQNLAWAFQLGLTTVSKIIEETCNAICHSLMDKYLKEPNLNDYLEIARGFYTSWNFPNCIGALDGKHINIQAPPNSGTQFFNYKKTFSIVLLAVCDSNYVFRLIDIGAYGSQSDGGILKNSIFGERFERGTMPIPEETNIPGTNIKMPYVMVGDQAFPLKPYLFRPFGGSQNTLTYQQKIFNYRLSRCRRVIENAFGILVARWRLLKQTIFSTPEHAELFSKTCIVLHNYCKISNNSTYCPPGYTDSIDENNGLWRTEVHSLSSVRRVGSNTSTRYLFELRNRVSEYFCNEGKLPFQHQKVTAGMDLEFPRTYN